MLVAKATRGKPRLARIKGGSFGASMFEDLLRGGLTVCVPPRMLFAEYPLVVSTGSTRRGGTRKHHFDGTNFQSHKLPENAATPTTATPAHPAPGLPWVGCTLCWARHYQHATLSVRVTQSSDN